MLAADISFLQYFYFDYDNETTADIMKVAFHKGTLKKKRQSVKQPERKKEKCVNGKLRKLNDKLSPSFLHTFWKWQTSKACTLIDIKSYAEAT